MFSNNKVTRVVATGLAVLVLAGGGLAVANSAQTPTTTAATAAAKPPEGGVPRTGANAPPQTPATAAAQVAISGSLPPGWTPGSGKLITGTAADKAKAIATAKYPGTVNRVLQLSDGSYAVHLFATTGNVHHVFVSKDFKITGTA
jgi:hypothetical protein